jgi:DMSO/TMAO reductase YedYZ molybdopterin-dependent catalytic subunit
MTRSSCAITSPAFRSTSIPTPFALEIKGKVDKPQKLSLQELKQFDAVETVAVNQCSGNSRGFVTPRVAGGHWATAPWAMRAGRACRSRPFSTRPASSAARAR